jgi:hypothetical protein
MRARVRRFAHLLERLGLAMAGAAGGLFVGAHVGSSIAALTSQAFLLAMMIAGAAGLYLGIDTPPLPFKSAEPQGARIDAAELLSAVGTFLAALAGLPLSPSSCCARTRCSPGPSPSWPAGSPAS